MKAKQTKLRHTVAVYNHKGGAGKTTTVLNLAMAIKEQGYRVLVIDADPQFNLTDLVAPGRTHESTIYDVLCNSTAIPVYRSERGLYYCPSTDEMNHAAEDLHNIELRELRLRFAFARPIDDHTGEGLTEWGSAFDFIFIDCAPALDDVVRNVLLAADGIIISAIPDRFALKGIGDAFGVLAGMKTKSETMPIITVPKIHGILLLDTGTNDNISRQFEEAIRKAFPDIFRSSIRHTKDIKESRAVPTDLFDTRRYNSRHHYAMHDFIALAKEYLKKWLNSDLTE